MGDCSDSIMLDKTDHTSRRCSRQCKVVLFE